MSHEQLLFTWSTFRDSSMGAKLKYFWKPRQTMKYVKIFSQKHASRTIYISRDPYCVILAWVQSWNNFEKLMKLGSPPNSFHKNMSHKQLHFTWSTFCDSIMGTKLKYFWITDETEKSAWIFDKNITHEQILLQRSTFRDSSMGTKLKYFWKIHEALKSDRIFSQKHISRTNTFHVTHISWFWYRYKIKIFLKNSWNCEVRQNLFTKTNTFHVFHISWF